MTPLFWAYSESVEVANELSAAAREIAGSSGGQAVVLEMDRPLDEVKAEHKLVLKGGSTPSPIPEVAAELIYRAAAKSQPSAILVGATRQGREVASRLGVKLGTGSMSEVFRLQVSGNMLQGERNVFAGRVVAKMSATMPCVATVKVGAYLPAGGSSGSVAELDVGRVAPRVKVIQSTRKEAGKVDLRKAKIIVSAGRGVKRKEDLSMLEGLARAFGAALGCSRPLSSDLGWLPEECHIGLTGINVSPDLYLAVGISGQLQHIAGIKDSKVIAAINSDKEAPIFQSADYGIVGDLYQVVPALQRMLGKRG